MLFLTRKIQKIHGVFWGIDLENPPSIYLSIKLIHCTYVSWETLGFPCLCEFNCWRVTSAIPFCIGIKPLYQLYRCVCWFPIVGKRQACTT
jgi:hypothetical protein